MSEPETSWPERCRNCDATLHGRFCSDCGESHRHDRLDFRDLAEGALDGLVNLEATVLRTLADLSLSPARVCRDYLDGRRVIYVHPFKYAIAGLAFAFLVAEILRKLHGADTGDADANLAYQVYLQWGQLANLVAMPVLAAALHAMFMAAPRKLRWIEHYVVVLYTLGHASIIQGLLAPMQPYLGTAGNLLSFLIPVGLLTWALAGVAQTRWWTTLPRVLVGMIILQLTSSALLFSVSPELLEALRAAT